jgi:putative flippase GtrA
VRQDSREPQRLGTLSVRAGNGDPAGSSARRWPGRVGAKRCRSAAAVMDRLRARSLATRVLRFGMMSGLSAAMTLGIPILLHEGFALPADDAVAIAFTIAFGVNFVVAKYFVFRAIGSTLGDLLKFCIASFLFRYIDYTMFEVLYHVLFIGYPIALAIILPFSTIMKFFTFHTVVFKRKV